MKPLQESILDKDYTGPSDNDMTVDVINSRRNPKGGKITTDSWGHPVKVGDYIIGNADCPSIGTDVTNWLTGNNLVVGRIVAMHNGGLDVWILDNNHVDPDELKGDDSEWGVSTCNTYGGVIVTVKTKTGFIKADPKLLKRLFT